MDTNLENKNENSNFGRFKGTKGDIIRFNERIESPGQFHDTVICRLENINSLEKEANSDLIVDAFNVRQQINFDLPELLRQRNEMLEMLKKLVDRMEENDLGNFNAVRQAKQLIKQATKQ